MHSIQEQFWFKGLTPLLISRSEKAGIVLHKKWFAPEKTSVESILLVTLRKTRRQRQRERHQTRGLLSQNNGCARAV